MPDDAEDSAMENYNVPVVPYLDSSTEYYNVPVVLSWDLSPVHSSYENGGKRRGGADMYIKIRRIYYDMNALLHNGTALFNFTT